MKSDVSLNLKGELQRRKDAADLCWVWGGDEIQAVYRESLEEALAFAKQFTDETIDSTTKGKEP